MRVQVQGTSWLVYKGKHKAKPARRLAVDGQSSGLEVQEGEGRVGVIRQVLPVPRRAGGPVQVMVITMLVQVKVVDSHRLAGAMVPVHRSTALTSCGETDA